MPEHKRVRIEDVAIAAGVSTQTVSRVLNKRPEVLPETRQRVLEAMSLLGYEPSLFARGLAGNKSHIIGLIAEDLSEPNMAHFIASVEAEARRNGYFLLVSSNIDVSSEQPIHARMLTSSHVDGLIFSRLGEIGKEAQYLQELLERNIPIVALGDWPEGQENFSFSSVGLNEVDGGYQATAYLLGLEHRRIGMITGPEENSAARGRSLGYEKALREHGIPVDLALIVEGDWSFGSGYQAAQTLLLACPDLTAIFCQNDRMAIGAMQALQQAGLRVPESISIIGFDDIPDAAYSNPALTTMRQSAETIGREAARLLFSAIEEPNRNPQRIEVQASLVERSSCWQVILANG